MACRRHIGPLTSDLLNLRRHLAGCFQLPDKTVASAMGGFDKDRRLGIVVKSFSQLTNSNFEHRFTDECFRPDDVEKFLFGDELARMSNEVVEYRESLRPELNHLRSSPQALVRKVQAKGVKDYLFLVPHCS